VLQCVAAFCSALQCVAECCSVLQCATVWYRTTRTSHIDSALRAGEMRFRCVAMCCSMLKCVAACCSVLQCVAVRYFIIRTSHIASTLEAGEMGLASKLACVVAPRTSNAPSAQKNTFCQVPHFYITRMCGWA